MTAFCSLLLGRFPKIKMGNHAAVRTDNAVVTPRSCELIKREDKAAGVQRDSEIAQQNRICSSLCLFS